MTRRSPVFGTPEERLRSFLDIEPGPDGCWIFTGATERGGYGKLTIESRTVRAHVLAYELWVGPRTPGLLICHTCDRPPCCRPDHLFLDTHAGNSADMVSKRRNPRGEARPNTVLTEDDVRIIRSSTDTAAALALRFGVSRGTISKIRRRLKWAWLD